MRVFAFVLVSMLAYGAPRDTLVRGVPVLEAVYSLDYDRAAELATRLGADDPADPLGAVLLARVYWSQQLSLARALSIERYAIGDFFSDAPRYKLPVDSEADRRFREASQRAIVKARAWLAARPSDSTALFLAGLAYQNQASYDYSIRGERWAAFKAGEKTLNYFRDAIEADPAFADPKLAVGIADYVVETVPWAVRWLSFMLGYRGSRERGKRELEMVAERGILLGDDARTILALFYSRDRQFDRSAAKLEELHRKYPRNYLVHLELAQSNLSAGRKAEAVALCRAVRDKAKSRTDGYERIEPALPSLRLGVALRATGDLTGAERELRVAVSLATAAARTRAIAQLELAKTLDRLNRRNEALSLYREIAAGPDFAGVRKEVQALIGQPFAGE